MNVLNTGAQCLPVDFSTLCKNVCVYPAICNARTGRCQCLAITPSLTVVQNQSSIQETCACSDEPLLTFLNGSCLPSIIGIVLLRSFVS